jgi:hypothetical protein
VQPCGNLLTLQRCLLPPSSGLIEAGSTSRTSVNFYETTQHNIPEDSFLYSRRR